MKNIMRFKKAFFKATLIASTLFGASCNNYQKADDSKVGVEEHFDTKNDNIQTKNDTQFLVNAAEINLIEIKLGQLAQQTSKISEVSELGKMMEEAHTKCLDGLIILAQKKMILIPTTPTDNTLQAYKKLSNKSGNDFDVAYCDMMVNGHMDAIAIFDKAHRETTDEDIKQWIAATLPELRSHLTHSIECQKHLQESMLTKGQ